MNKCCPRLFLLAAFQLQGLKLGCLATAFGACTRERGTCLHCLYRLHTYVTDSYSSAHPPTLHPTYVHLILTLLYTNTILSSNPKQYWTSSKH